MEQNTEFFTTKELKFEEVEIKGGKNHYIEGHIATGDLDFGNDIITNICMDDIVAQFEDTEIKLDWEHEALLGDSKLEKTINRTKNPIGKVIEVKRDEKGIWVKAILNKANERFGEIWNSIKNGFLDSFSIGYYVQDKVYKKNNGIMTRLLNKVKLINIALTGNPMNPNATITSAFMKSLEREDKKLYKGQDVNFIMETDTKKLEAEMKSLKEEMEAKTKELETVKAEKKAMEEEKEKKEIEEEAEAKKAEEEKEAKKAEEEKEAEEAETEKKSKEEMKSVIDGFESRIKKLEETPLLKSLGPAIIAEVKSEPVSLLRGTRK